MISKTLKVYIGSPQKLGCLIGDNVSDMHPLLKLIISKFIKLCEAFFENICYLFKLCPATCKGMVIM